MGLPVMLRTLSMPVCTALSPMVCRPCMRKAVRIHDSSMQQC